MEIRSYNAELGISNILFKRVFTNIRIERTDSAGNKVLIPVNCLYGQRSRILKNWQNSEKRANIRLPLIIINRTGYSRDSLRVNNMHNEVKYEITSKNRVVDYMTPVPITIQYEVTVFAKYPSDIDLIASNFMVFFNSSIYVSCVHPKYEDVKMNNQVIMEDSVSEEHPDELDGATNDFITTTFSFLFKTFLFAGLKQALKRPVLILSSFISSYVSSDVHVLAPDEIDAFQELYPNACMSAALTSLVSSEVSTLVDSTEISDLVYDEFAPIIKKIDISLYPTPLPSAFIPYMEFADSISDIAYSVSGYISSESYSSSYETYEDKYYGTRTRLSSIVPNDMYYEDVDTYEVILPYKNRLIWKIDELSTNDFPSNVNSYRRFLLH